MPFPAFNIIISTRIAPKVQGNVNNELFIRPNSIKLSPCVQLLTCMQTTISRRKGPVVCREKLVLVYLCMLLLAGSYAPEPNPGPRTPKYPCGICRKTLKWTTPGVQCDSCKLWYHQECIYMPDEVYTSLNNVSWECVQCGLPNFASNLFDITLFETSINNDPLQTDLGKSIAIFVILTGQPTVPRDQLQSQD